MKWSRVYYGWAVAAAALGVYDIVIGQYWLAALMVLFVILNVHWARQADKPKAPPKLRVVEDVKVREDWLGRGYEPIEPPFEGETAWQEHTRNCKICKKVEDQ